MSIRPYEKNNLRDTRFDDFYDMIDSFFNDDFTPQRAMRSATFKVDVIDEDKDYKVEAELPGFSKDEIDIDFEDGKLTISAEKNEEVNEENKEKKEKILQFPWFLQLRLLLYLYPAAHRSLWHLTLIR